MASLSKCHLCRQYHYCAGKQPVNILMGEISFDYSLKIVEICCFTARTLVVFLWSAPELKSHHLVQRKETRP